ncbi:PTS glucose transporter subunit IIA [Lactiplantibacillus sp. DA1]|uniref:PTS sugar transporter subunit IIA n=1 Tax=Lactiplantibacillus sp. DA1 TaxID=3079857 RepID=UPI00292A6361|nr:PTS glucose transporter subunit IIA [Lactiplantibacillus sp. DA1]MDV0429534.1 PTS glucose transporter subunit IIA [Lactiplantibacillus sp. DA1]
MFKLRRKKVAPFEVVAPIEGICLPITAVKDDVFAKKMMGDGFAIEPIMHATQVVAPISGKIVALPASKHAIGITDEIHGISILVHVGLNTVSLAGKGFTALVKLNQTVDVGTPLLTLDWNLMMTSGLDMTTMVVFTDGYTGTVPIGHKQDQHLKAGDPVLKQA